MKCLALVTEKRIVKYVSLDFSTEKKWCEILPFWEKKNCELWDFCLFGKKYCERWWIGVQATLVCLAFLSLEKIAQVFSLF